MYVRRGSGLNLEPNVGSVQVWAYKICDLDKSQAGPGFSMLWNGSGLISSPYGLARPNWPIFKLREFLDRSEARPGPGFD
jgi:hypothetical protein